MNTFGINGNMVWVSGLLVWHQVFDLNNALLPKLAQIPTAKLQSTVETLPNRPDLIVLAKGD